MKKFKNVQISFIVIVLCLIAFLGFSYFFLKEDVTISAAILMVFLIFTSFVFYFANKSSKEMIDNIENDLDLSMKDALKEGMMGILVYDDNYEITWTSSFFKDHHLDINGEKVLSWLPELHDVIIGDVDRVNIVVNDEKYNVIKKDDANVLLFKDITKEYDLNVKLAEDSYVLGFVNFDNFDETNLSEDDISYANTNIKIPVLEYFRQHKIVYKTLRNNRLMLILNEKQFKVLMNDRFSIMTIVRREAKKANLDVTLSMSFARGSDSLNELDSEAMSLLELAQTRGGDQVVVRKIGEEAVFYGGSSEAREKASKVKVRVTANALRQLINHASNVIMTGHNNADADCIGSAICMSCICKSLGKEAYIITKSGGVEPMINDVMRRFKDDLDSRHHFVSESNAQNFLNENSLVIMLDHHSLAQSNVSNLLKEAHKVVILDHHRRRADLDVEPILTYIEASSSSTCEMVCEFLPYMVRSEAINPTEANMMYLGLVIDTNHFRVRTGSRTFDVAKTLKQYGADPALCESLLEEPYDNVMLKSKIVNSGKKYNESIVIATMEDDVIYPRSIASQACDTLVQMREIEAGFVICKDGNNQVMISGRSKGKINVQVILEKLGGGGHMKAAGAQVVDVMINDAYKALIDAIDSYLKEANDNESNSVS